MLLPTLATLWTMMLTTLFLTRTMPPVSERGTRDHAREQLLLVDCYMSRAVLVLVMVVGAEKEALGGARSRISVWAFAGLLGRSLARLQPRRSQEVVAYPLPLQVRL